MTTTLDRDTATDTTGTASARLTDEIAQILAQQGFEYRRPDGEDSDRLTITNAPEGRCEIETDTYGYVTCDYCPRAGKSADPADISRAVARLLAAPQDGPASEHPGINPAISLKGAIGRAMRVSGLLAELRLWANDESFSVDADVAISNPQQPGRGTVLVTDDGWILWEVNVNDLHGHAREIVITLTDMLAQPVSPAGSST